MNWAAFAKIQREKAEEGKLKELANYGTDEQRRAGVNALEGKATAQELALLEQAGATNVNSASGRIHSAAFPGSFSGNVQSNVTPAVGLTPEGETRFQPKTGNPTYVYKPDTGTVQYSFTGAVPQGAQEITGEQYQDFGRRNELLEAQTKKAVIEASPEINAAYNQRLQETQEMVNRATSNKQAEQFKSSAYTEPTPSDKARVLYSGQGVPYSGPLNERFEKTGFSFTEEAIKPKIDVDFSLGEPTLPSTKEGRQESFERGEQISYERSVFGKSEIYLESKAEKQYAKFATSQGVPLNLVLYGGARFLQGSAKSVYGVIKNPLTSGVEFGGWIAASYLTGGAAKAIKPLYPITSLFLKRSVDAAFGTMLAAEVKGKISKGQDPLGAAFETAGEVAPFYIIGKAGGKTYERVRVKEYKTVKLDSGEIVVKRGADGAFDYTFKKNVEYGNTLRTRDIKKAPNKNIIVDFVNVLQKQEAPGVLKNLKVKGQAKVNPQTGSIEVIKFTTEDAGFSLGENIKSINLKPIPAQSIKVQTNVPGYEKTIIRDIMIPLREDVAILESGETGEYIYTADTRQNIFQTGIVEYPFVEALTIQVKPFKRTRTYVSESIVYDKKTKAERKNILKSYIDYLEYPNLKQQEYIGFKPAKRAKKETSTDEFGSGEGGKKAQKTTESGVGQKQILEPKTETKPKDRKPIIDYELQNPILETRGLAVLDLPRTEQEGKTKQEPKVRIEVAERDRTKEDIFFKTPQDTKNSLASALYLEQDYFSEIIRRGKEKPTIDYFNNGKEDFNLRIISRQKIDVDIIPDPNPITPEPKIEEIEEPKPKEGGRFSFRKDEDSGLFGYDGYDVLVKSRGAFKKANKNPMDYYSARDYGAEAVDNTTAAQFKLIKTKSKKPVQSNATNYFNSNLDKFRKGNSGDNWIENKKSRIDSEGEFQGITIEGWAANRRKAAFSNFEF